MSGPASESVSGTGAEPADGAEKGRRLSPDDRRNQLVAAGLELASSGAVAALTASEVADAAGVSKGLVFHYFSTQGELHSAIARAAAEELVTMISSTDETLGYDERLAQGLDTFIGYIEQRPTTYASFARNAAADPGMQSVFEDTRNAIVEIIASAIGVDVMDPRLRLFLAVGSPWSRR